MGKAYIAAELTRQTLKSTTLGEALDKAWYYCRQCGQRFNASEAGADVVNYRCPGCPIKED